MEMALTLFLASSLFFQAAFGEIICEDLPVELCSFSIASSGKRCLLDTNNAREGSSELQCCTTEIRVKNLSGLIDSDECVSACGVDRMSIGISSNLLLDPKFTTKLCTTQCYYNCPNIVELYYSLALGEGVFLPDLCELQRSMPVRAMSQLLGSGRVLARMISILAAGPVSNEKNSVAYPPTSV